MGNLRILVILFLLVTSLSIVQVPLRTNLLTVSDSQYAVTMRMADYSDEHDLSYPHNYVFSKWGENRMHNYFVNGQSRSYSFAQANYGAFVTATDGELWYQRLEGRAGFVVTTDDIVTNASALGTRLHEQHGSRTEATAGLAHYRLIIASKDGSYKAFAIVPGAVITGTAEPNASITVRTDVTVEAMSFPYVRQTTTDADGRFRVRVAYPGTYHLGNRTVTVPESAILNGTEIAEGTE